MIAEDSASAQIIKRFLRGQDIERWYANWEGLWLIFAKRGIDIERYPAVMNHLQRFRAELEPKPSDWASGTWHGRKPGFYKWFEIQDSVDYWQGFEAPKIMYSDIAKSNRFFLDSSAYYSGNTTYFLPAHDWYLLGVLNSKSFWMAFAGISVPFGERAGEFRYRFFSQYVGKVPIPTANDSDREAVGRLAERCNTIAPELHALQQLVRRRIQSTFGQSGASEVLGSLNQKAQAWSELSIKELGLAIKSSFKLSASPFRNPCTADEWEPYLAEKRAEVERMTRELADAEAEINDRVFRLFNLTPAEIALLLKEVEH